MDNNSNNSFSYTYSAKEASEISRIREKYSVKEESSLERLHRLDRGVTKKARAVAIALGVIGSLVLGIGMSLAMTDLSMILGKYSEYSFFIGIVIGIIGIITISIAYPIYNAMVTKERERIAPEILRLTDELLNK